MLNITDFTNALLKDYEAPVTTQSLNESLNESCDKALNEEFYQEFEAILVYESIEERDIVFEAVLKAGLDDEYTIVKLEEMYDSDEPGILITTMSNRNSNSVLQEIEERFEAASGMSCEDSSIDETGYSVNESYESEMEDHIVKDANDNDYGWKSPFDLFDESCGGQKPETSLDEDLDDFFDAEACNKEIKEDVNPRPHESDIRDMIDSGALSTEFVADALLRWLSDDELAEFINLYVDDYLDSEE